MKKSRKLLCVLLALVMVVGLLPGMAFAVVTKDDTLYERTWGDCTSTHSPFTIGSLSKSFTALAIMQLVDEGSIDLDEPAFDLIFMDMTTYEQISLPVSDTDGKADWLLESQQCRVLLYNGQPIDIEVPVSLVMTVVKTEPGVKGDTVSNVTKPATLETGVTIQVPIFVNEGDRVKVDTRTREYLGRD